MHLPEIQNNRI